MPASSISFQYVTEVVERGLASRPKIPVTLGFNEKLLETLGLIDSLGRDGIFGEFDITFEENARRVVLQKIRR